MPDVMPGREWKAARERGVEQSIQRGRAEHEHAEYAAEDREIEVKASRERAALVVVDPALRLPPRERPGYVADEEERDVDGRLAVGMRVHPHELAAEDADH